MNELMTNLRKKYPAKEAEHLYNTFSKITDSIWKGELIHGSFINACVTGDWETAEARADLDNGKNLAAIREFTLAEKIKNIDIMPILWLGDVLHLLDDRAIMKAVQNYIQVRYFHKVYWELDVCLVFEIRVIDEDICLEGVCKVLDDFGMDYQYLENVSTGNITLKLFQI